MSLVALAGARVFRLGSMITGFLAAGIAGALVLFAVLQASPVRAQSAQNILSDIELTEVDSGETRLTLNFTDRAPAYSVSGDGREHVEITLPNTRDGGVAAAAAKLTTSLVRTVQLKPNGQDLVLIFDEAAPIHIAAASGPAKRLVLNLTRAGTGVSLGPGDPGGLHGLPREVDPPPGEDGFEMIPLKYADVSEVVGVLTDGATVRSNDSFSPREPGFGSPSAGGNGYNPPPVQQSPEDRSPLGQAVDGSIAIDRRLNAVWVKGSPAHIARVKAEIAQIDVPVDSVILETEVVELTGSGARNLGIDFTNSSGQIAVGALQSGQFVSSVFGGGKSAMSSVSLQAALYAQIRAGKGRIVSRPRIAAQSGSSAKIITGDALPILTAITLSGVNGVSQQVQYVNVGVTLQIAPRISSDDYVTSHVFCVVSSVTGYSQGYPTISQRNAETSATVRDGESFVIGGLTQEEEIKSRGAVPLLSGVPLVGQAFRNDSSTKAKTELYIVVTPHIIRRLTSGSH